MKVESKYNLGDLVAYKKVLKATRDNDDQTIRSFGMIRSMAIADDGLVYDVYQPGTGGQSVKESEVIGSYVLQSDKNPLDYRAI